MTSANDQAPVATDDAGIPAPSHEFSATVGANGPLVLQDHYLIEQMANFNRERIPERQPHAKGSGAFLKFETTQDVTAYTKAAVFQPGEVTEGIIRFSTVAGERGSPDTWRDPRGFALKLWTREGNWDMVGNNTPVFFMRDPMKFQNFIRSQKRLARNGLRDHDMQWDFWTLSPESKHQVTWLMGDRGIPKTWRHMNGYSSHTYMWINAQGEEFWVKYHFKSDQGVECLTEEEAGRLAGEDADYHQRDLYEAIERGEFPSWTLHVQIMPFEDAKTYRFNPFDLTKVWPHSDYPLREVGKMTLNRNPEDYHTEIEQVAFEPNNQPSGLGLSPDKMLLARGFSYADAHRARLGVNYKQIPVNSPQGTDGAPVHRRGRDARREREGPGVRAEHQGRPADDGDDPAADVVLRRRDPAGRVRGAPRGLRRGPGPHDDARGLGRRRRGTASSRTSRATCPRASATTCSSARSSTGAPSTRAWVSAWRPASASSPARNRRCSARADTDAARLAATTGPFAASAAANGPVVRPGLSTSCRPRVRSSGPCRGPRADPGRTVTSR